MSFCLETYLQQSDNYKILLAQSTFKEARKVIKENSKEIIHVKPGEKILGVRIIGIPPIPIGINKDKGTVVITYTKPCNGTGAIELPVSEEDLKDIISVSIDA
jgi:hypothetical protein